MRQNETSTSSTDSTTFKEKIRFICLINNSVFFFVLFIIISDSSNKLILSFEKESFFVEFTLHLFFFHRQQQETMDDKLARLEAAIVRLENLARQQSSNNQNDSNDDSSADAVDQTPVIRDYQFLITDSLQPFLNLSQKIGGDVVTITEYVSRLFNAQQQFLRQAVQSQKPDDKTIQTAIGAQSTEIGNITEFTSKNRKSAQFNHLSTISEGIPALGWILVAPTPAPHIKEMVDSAQFYSNRVLKDFKEKDQTHVDWVKAWGKVLNDLHAYVKQYHTTGLVWGSQGKRDFGSVATATPAAAASAADASASC